MQIWIFFQAGTGGDGIANLLERSNNVTPLDGVTEYWRIHRIVDGGVKFYAPNIDNNGCFRFNQPFDQTNNKLSDAYVDIVNQNLNCVVTSHDTSLELLTASDCQNILTNNQIKVLVTSTDHNHAAIMTATKNLAPFIKPRLESTFDLTKFDYVLDADLVKTNWEYLNSFCKDVGLDLDHAQYLQYLDLLKGNKTFMKNNFNVEEWISTINGPQVTYSLVSVWQPGDL
jgi:hypothetical protein